MNLIVVLVVFFNLSSAATHHGDWSEWSNFGRCSNMCGKGAQLRTRTCTNPEPMNGGSYCLGPASEQIECFEKPCEDEWTSWSEFSLCSCTHGRGYRTRTREKNCTVDVSGGNSCGIKESETRECTASCNLVQKVDGGWSSWGEVLKCSKPCGGGIRIMSRTCNNPVPANGGLFCPGSSVQTSACNEQPCKVSSTQRPFVTLPSKMWVTLKKRSARISLKKNLNRMK
ncbi:coadhesin-like [Ostrea edulis]|uniref:coadhesin-like n=1 Tax=Ostrea edulis TaxID=37623 RepID=UPI0024AEB97C|nr:coadhesin-like [Ostrea edulis]